ncbi:MAG: flavodoxin domain-containing protein [Eubacteriales bacterium]|nr:flavodoxin domain-containing protein [Eubacteriales bacterium]MDD3882658.1 flavodoxin domain-containing protein [Eubacteriales bacterium]MDD4512770.1 flavodoxin domain-containing protein [Eubacteriales bacterium]
MKTAVVVMSKHHGNTRKLVDAIAREHEITVIDAGANSSTDLSGYDCIGFASGIAYGKFYKQIGDIIENDLPSGKKVFFLYTCARNDKDFAAHEREQAQKKGCKVLGVYGCSGFNTYSVLKLIGGINKGHPDESELRGAVDFFAALPIGEGGK